MTPEQEVAYAQLIALGIQSGVKIYTEIQQNHQNQLASIEEVLAGADVLANKVIATADAELAKLPPKQV